jgi:protein-L-isoaspartate O-methyltransferase
VLVLGAEHEIGTGTGYNAALLAEGLSGGPVISVDIDADLIGTARARPRGFDVAAVVAVGDGAGGYVEGAPYDRIIATCSMPRIPPAWLTQTVPDGLILVNLLS